MVSSDSDYAHFTGHGVYYGDGTIELLAPNYQPAYGRGTVYLKIAGRIMGTESAQYSTTSPFASTGLREFSNNARRTVQPLR